MTFKISLILIFILTLTSCTSVKMKESPKTYSKETVKSFEEIERENALERYRQLRLKNWERTKRSRTRNIRPKRYTRPKRKISKPKKTIIPTNPEEQKIEVDQNLKFFCMEKRKDSRFSGSTSCESFTNNILESCKKSFDWNDKKLTRCIKSKLK